jgi:hypothetical protein
MKAIRYFLFFTSFVLVHQASSASTCAATSDTSSVSREQLGRELIILRDSVDMTLASMGKMLGKNAPLNNQQLNNDFKSLSVERSELEDTIEEVASRVQPWDSNTMNNMVYILREKRHSYHVILERVKHVVVIKRS